ncbi:hypothetical protein V1264_006067 [Littorina saxatilis]
MLEALGEHLYAKIEEVQEAYHVDLDVAKVTGVLLELGEEQVLKLLQDEKLLHQSVKRVVQHVPVVCSNIRHWSLLARDEEESVPKPQRRSETDPEDAEQLYEHVFQLEPQLSTNITGMLLELGGSEVKALLQSPTRLTEAVNRAEAVYFQQSSSPPHNSPFTRETMVPQQHLKFSTAEERGPQKCGLSENGTCSAINKKQSNRKCMAAEGDQKCRESHGRESMADEVKQMCSHIVNIDTSAEEMGERVYSEVEKLYPDLAAKLTGMILDMGETRVQKLLHDRAQLHKAINIAFASLSSNNR